ncbi:hypothetical protein AB0939_20625 [Streptomyces sp. NPDC006990]|uniref:hypothetical protein n=1 Tax=Streptomyces sp. NPDC006990 TaxID=3154481 RepID=UPI0034544415
MNATTRQLLEAADLLLGDRTGHFSDPAVHGEAAPPAVFTAAAVNRNRGAAFALRAALENAVAARLEARNAPPAIRTGTQRAAFLWLRCCVEPETARRAKAVWCQLCLGCHYHQYEIGPAEDQVRAWRTEVVSVVALLAV